MNYLELSKYIDSISIDEVLRKTTCLQDISQEKKRYHNLLEEAKASFSDGDYHFISSPSRSEIGGNHTDHQHGNVLAATLSIDNVCACKSNDSNTITFIDNHFGKIFVDLSNLSAKEEEKNTSISLIKGIAYKLKEFGYKINGFDAVCDSKVLIGASISSSACFEVMIAEIFNVLFNEGKISNIEKAIACQYTENIYFGKASGLLDQLTISVGGFVAADFKDPSNPHIENFDFSFEKHGYDFLIVNTKGTHANLTDEYSSIPHEMKEVSNELNVEYLADATYEEFISNISSIRSNISNDRALLRSIHFFNETKRAVLEKEAVRNDDICSLFKLMKESGRSSYMYLQNVYATNNTKSQSLSLALALTEDFLKEEGTYRMQGGGFEGTIIAIVPKNLTQNYEKLIESVFGPNSILKCCIRPLGTIEVI